MRPPRQALPVRRARPGEETDYSSLAEEVRQGFQGPLPSLPSKLFYDDRGSALFDEITRLPEYYQTRTEESILRAHADDIAAATKAREIVELGSGTSAKLALLVDALMRGGSLQACTLFDINERDLGQAVEMLGARHPTLKMRGMAGDFLTDLESLGRDGGRLIVFLGSTIGNLHPREVPPFLRQVAAALEPGDAFLVGLDLVKDHRRLEAAYNDSRGVTAAFNLNILHVINDRLGASFDLDAFEHVAFYDPDQAWIEMRLKAVHPTRVRIPEAGIDRSFERGDEIRTEISCKYTRGSWDALAEGTGLERRAWYTDSDRLFALALNRRRPEHGPSAG